MTHLGGNTYYENGGEIMAAVGDISLVYSFRYNLTQQLL